MDKPTTNTYKIELITNVGKMVLDNIIEFVFAKKYMYYSTVNDVGRIDRSNIHKASRLMGDRWVEIKMKQFFEKKNK